MNFHKIGWIHWNILPTHPWFLKQLAARIWTCMDSTMDGGWGRLPKWLLAVVNEPPERDPNASIWREHIPTTWVLWIKHVVVMGPPKTCWSRRPFWRGQTFWTSAKYNPPSNETNSNAKPDCPPLPGGKEPAASADTGCIMILSWGLGLPEFGSCNFPEICKLFCPHVWPRMTHARGTHTCRITQG